ncbi:L-fuconate dehydratase OS=Castellaniella defragrans OX=75697 GN=HNR28_001509 PE=4 SV=1 [Castellaniella defragrans]
MSRSTAIKAVKVHFLSIPLESPLITAAFPIPAIDTAMMQITTEGGLQGAAWSFAFGRGRVASLVRMMEDLGEIAVGHDALDTEALWSRLSKAVGFIGQRGVAAAAMSAIDTSCWDIKGKAAGLPVYQLLGGFRHAVEAYASQGLWLDRSRDALAKEAASYVSQGFNAVKMRAGKANEDEDVERVRSVREAIGPDCRLMIDVNQAWNLKQTLRMGRKLEEFDVFWLEEPMPYNQLDDYVQATRGLAMPLCTGESFYLKDEILDFVRHRAADYFMPDMMRMAGVTEWMKVAHACEASHAMVTPHLFMEHSSHLAAACPNVVWQEYQPWWQPVMKEPIAMADGKIHLSDKPGFGFELSEKALAEFKVS